MVIPLSPAADTDFKTVITPLLVRAKSAAEISIRGGDAVICYTTPQFLLN